MRGLSPETLQKLLLSVGSHRVERPLSPIEVGRALQDARDAGASLNDLAKALHLDGTSMVSRFLRLLTLSTEVQHLVDWGQTASTIAFTAASELSRLNSSHDQERVSQAALERQLTSPEVKQVVQICLRSQQPIEDCIAQVLRLRPRVERRHVFVGAVVGDALRARLSALPQVRRDEVLRRVVLARFPSIATFGSRLGIDRYTITGGDELAVALTQGGQDFEKIINEGLNEMTTLA